MSIVLVGSTSGSITLQEPAVAGTTVLTLPATSGTLITTGTTGQVIASGALPIGSVLQVVSTFTSTNAVNAGTSYADVTNLTVSITPKFSTSKILVTWFVNGVCSTANNSTIVQGYLQLADGSNNQIIQIANQGVAGGASNNLWNVFSGTYLHSPATTSATTYKIRFYSPTGSGIQNNNYQTTSGGGSSITVQEIAA